MIRQRDVKKKDYDDILLFLFLCDSMCCTYRPIYNVMLCDRDLILYITTNPNPNHKLQCKLTVLHAFTYFPKLSPINVTGRK